jgi:uncharacterized membrane protein
MKALRTFIADTVLGGVVFLVPLFVLLMMGKKLWEFFQNLGGNLTKMLGVPFLAGVGSRSIVAAVLILLVCFLGGLLTKWSIAGSVRTWFESTLHRLPLYDYYKTLVEQKLELTEKPARPAVLLRLLGGWQPGIVVEEYANGETVVFVPLSPKTTDGTVYLVGPKDLRPSSLNEKTLNAVLLKQGKGLVP